MSRSSESSLIISWYPFPEGEAHCSGRGMQMCCCRIQGWEGKFEKTCSDKVLSWHLGVLDCALNSGTGWANVPFLTSQLVSLSVSF